MALRPHVYQRSNWRNLAAAMSNLQAIRELFDNMIFIEDKLNATEGHIYFRDTELGIGSGSASLLTLRDNGRGMTLQTWLERASGIGRAADTLVDYTPDLAQTLSRFGVGFKAALPPLSEDVYIFVCHGHGIDRERFIARMGESLNQGAFDEYKDGFSNQLSYATLALPKGFVYNPRSASSAQQQMIIALPEDDPRYSEKIRDLNKARNLLLMASPFKSLEALLSLLDDFGEGTGVMHVRAQRQPIRGNLVPAVVNGIRDIRDEETQTTLRAYLGQTYLFHKAFKPLLQARVEEQTRQQRVLNPECPAPELLEPQIKLFVEGSEVNFEDHPFVKALKESGCLEKDIEVKEIISEDAEGRDIVLGWCTFTYQAKEYSTLRKHGKDHSSGILEGYSCCMLSREPGFQDRHIRGAQSQYLHDCEYWNARNDKCRAYKSLEAMLKADPEKPIEMPFSAADGRLWGHYNIDGPNARRKASDRGNFKYCFAGAGVLGLFLANEKHLPVNVAKDGLRDKELLPYARALVIRELMQWVYSNPPAEYLKDQEALRAKMMVPESEGAETRADRARAAAQEPPGPSQPITPPQAAARAELQTPSRKSKQDANARMTGKRPATGLEPGELPPSPKAPLTKKRSTTTAQERPVAPAAAATPAIVTSNLSRVDPAAAVPPAGRSCVPSSVGFPAPLVALASSRQVIQAASAAPANPRQVVQAASAVPANPRQVVQAASLAPANTRQVVQAASAVPANPRRVIPTVPLAPATEARDPRRPVLVFPALVAPAAEASNLRSGVSLIAQKALKTAEKLSKEKLATLQPWQVEECAKHLRSIEADLEQLAAYF